MMWNQLKTLLLLGALTAVFAGIGAAMGPGWMWIGLAFALMLNVGAYWFSDRMVLRMHRAQEVPAGQLEWLRDDLRVLASRAGIPEPRLVLIPSPQPNAFATGRNPERGVVAVTEGILRLLGRDELRGVLAHEIAHIRNRDVLIATVAAILASAVSAVANVFQWIFLFGGAAGDEDGPHPLAALAMMLIAPIAATLIQLGISRSREFVADETAAQLTGDPDALARALERLERGVEAVPVEASPATASLFIVQPLRGTGGIARMFSTHPPTAERVRRLRALLGTLRTVA